MFCPICDAYVEDDDLFCPDCDTALWEGGSDYDDDHGYDDDGYRDDLTYENI